jgi:hypothetical protein
MNQNLIPYKRTAEICGEVLGTSVSVGMLCELNACYELLSAESAAMRAEITASSTCAALMRSAAFAIGDTLGR